MKNFVVKIPETEFEINQCHKIREYVLKESFADVGIKFDRYDKNHLVHSAPNISLV